jgi:NTP pyrophosphatase (non-canonical NTP hydrolase)
MDIKTYLTESEKTLSEKFFATDTKNQKLLHAVIGLSTESGELLDQMKKVVYYGKELDRVNIKEELGDLMWYMAILMRELDLDMDDVLEVNINKLRTRYGEKFNSEGALNRNLDKEREILEK